MNIRRQTIVEEFNISNATLQNWLKTNCLTSTKDGSITSESYRHFKKNILGKDKLNKRANKQYLDRSNTNNKDTPHTSTYEGSLSSADKNKRGIYYTPDNVIDAMFAELPIIKASDSFLDPCCGSGNFLMKALEKGFKPENIYGHDVDQIALKIANDRFHQTTGQHSKNINTLNLLTEIHNKKYNFIFTNPPWGYKFTARQKITFANKFNDGTKVDSSALFVLICLKIIQEEGTLGILLPDSFFNITAFKSVRKILLKKTLLRLINHNKPFHGLQTKAYSFILKNNDHLTRVQCKTKTNQYTREQTDFINNPNHIINFNTTQNEAEVITHIYSYPHQTLEGKAKWGLGIVTGNNAKHLIKIKLNDHRPIYKGCHIQKGNIRESHLYIVDDFSKLQQTADKKLYLANKKIVYRFINAQLIFALDEKQRYFLNSANFLILHRELSMITEEQLIFLMNTEIMSWLFKKLFDTHKILRSDLERLPIFTHFFKDYSYYCEEDLSQYLNIEKYDGTFRVRR